MIAYSYIFILLTLAAGYSALKLSHFFKYRIINYNGQELFFSSAVVGLLIFCFGYLFCLMTTSIYPPINQHLTIFIDDRSIIYIVVGWIFSVPIILLLINKIWSNDYSISSYIDEQNDGIERILERSQIDTKPVAITLSTGKIYVGLVVQSFFSPKENESFTITPLYSGYRDNNTQELYLTNEYHELFHDYEESDNDFNINDLVIALSIDEIVSVSIFSPSIYNHMLDKKAQN